MPLADPSPTALRLLACVEALGPEEEGTIGHDDWPGLVAVLERELALLRRLATDRPDSLRQLAPRAEKLRQRYAGLAARISAAQAQNREELAGLGETTRRMKSVRTAYLKA